jgi:tetratricopeptide (TPR) repeat protein
VSEIANYRAAADWARAGNQLELLVAAADRGFEMRLPAQEAASWLDEALMHAGRMEPAVRLRALKRAATVRWILDDLAGSRSFAEQALDQARALHDASAEFDSLRILGIALSLLGDYDGARKRIEQSIALAEQVEDVPSLILALGNSGDNELRAGELDQARDLLEQALDLVRDGAPRGRLLASALYALGDTELLANDCERAGRYYREALIEADRLGDERFVVQGFAGLAAVSAAQGETQRAGVLWGAVTAREEAIGRRIPHYDRRTYEKSVAAAAGPDFTAAAARGRTMPYPDAVAAALGNSQDLDNEARTAAPADPAANDLEICFRGDSVFGGHNT